MATLLIGFANGGLTLGALGTLHLRRLKVFGACIVTLEGEIPEQEPQGWLIQIYARTTKANLLLV